MQLQEKKTTSEPAQKASERKLSQDNSEVLSQSNRKPAYKEDPLLKSDEYLQGTWVDRILKEHPGLTAEDILREAKGAGFL